MTLSFIRIFQKIPINIADDSTSYNICMLLSTIASLYVSYPFLEVVREVIPVASHIPAHTLAIPMTDAGAIIGKSTTQARIQTHRVAIFDGD